MSEHRINGKINSAECLKFRLDTAVDRIRKGHSFEQVMEQVFGVNWQNNRRIEKMVIEHLRS